MHFELDPRAPASPSEQLADQVRFAVAAGRLVVGERVPSVRALAGEVRVNPNTVGRAWRELEREGVLEARRGEGMFIAPGAPARCRAAAGPVLAERLARVVRDACAAGLAPAELRQLLEQALSGVDHAPEAEDRRESA